jgi:hypothetical protein
MNLDTLIERNAQAFRQLESLIERNEQALVRFQELLNYYTDIEIRNRFEFELFERYNRFRKYCNKLITEINQEVRVQRIAYESFQDHILLYKEILINIMRSIRDQYLDGTITLVDLKIFFENLAEAIQDIPQTDNVLRDNVVLLSELSSLTITAINNAKNYAYIHFKPHIDQSYNELLDFMQNVDRLQEVVSRAA